MRLHPASRLGSVLLGLGLVSALLVVGHTSATGPTSDGSAPGGLALSAATRPQSDYQVLSGAAGLGSGTRTHAQVRGNTVQMDSTAAPVSTVAGAAVRGTWTSPWVTARNSFTQLIPSWKVTIPAGAWIEVSARVRTSDGRTSSYDTIARWSPREDQVKRTSFDAQTDDLAKVATDTVLSQAGPLAAWQVSVNMFHRTTTTASPQIVQVGAVATMPGSGTPATSTPRYGAKSLTVPAYSQMIHRGEYPQYGNGGEAWCSPTSTTMILGYYKALPPASQYAWVKSSYRDRVVDHIARITYDQAYSGTGNWPFNTSMAAYAGNGFVTRLADLRQAEKFIQAGIPLAASVSFGRGELSGAPISASNGHLMVISGFTADGDVIVNDPAASSDASVRRTYDRGQFERAWAHSQNTVYVIKDKAHPLPESTSTNW